MMLEESQANYDEAKAELLSLKEEKATAGPTTNQPGHITARLVFISVILSMIFSSINIAD